MSWFEPYPRIRVVSCWATVSSTPLLQRPSASSVVVVPPTRVKVGDRSIVMIGRVKTWGNRRTLTTISTPLLSAYQHRGYDSRQYDSFDCQKCASQTGYDNCTPLHRFHRFPNSTSYTGLLPPFLVSCSSPMVPVLPWQLRFWLGLHLCKAWRDWAREYYCGSRHVPSPIHL